MTFLIAVHLLLLLLGLEHPCEIVVSGPQHVKTAESYFNSSVNPPILYYNWSKIRYVCVHIGYRVKTYGKCFKYVKLKLKYKCT